MRLICTSVLKPTDLISVVESNISFASCVRPQGRLGNNVVGLMYSTISLNGDPCVASADPEPADADPEYAEWPTDDAEPDEEAEEAEEFDLNDDDAVADLMQVLNDDYAHALSPAPPAHPPPDHLLGGH